MTERVLTIAKNLGSSSSLTGNHRGATGHALDDHHPERLRLRAGMHDDVKGSHRRGNIFQKTGEPDLAGQPQSLSLLLKLERGPLAAIGLVNGAADDVTTNWNVGRNTSQRFQENLVPLPAREGRDQSDPNRSRRRRCEPGSGIQVQPAALGREALQIDRVVDGYNAQAGQHLLQVLGHAPGIDDRNATGLSKWPQQAAHQPARTNVVVNMPDQGRLARAGPSSQQMHFEPIGVNDVRLDFRQPARKIARVPCGGYGCFQ